MAVLDVPGADVVGHAVSEDVVTHIFLPDMERVPAQDNGQLHLIIQLGDKIQMAVDRLPIAQSPKDLFVEIDRVGLFAVIVHLLETVGFLGVLHVIFAQADDISHGMGDGGAFAHLCIVQSAAVAVLGRFLQQTALLRRKGPDEIVHRGVLQAQLLQGVDFGGILRQDADLLQVSDPTGEELHESRLLSCLQMVS